MCICDHRGWVGYATDSHCTSIFFKGSQGVTTPIAHLLCTVVRIALLLGKYIVARKVRRETWILTTFHVSPSEGRQRRYRALMLTEAVMFQRRRASCWFGLTMTV